MEEAHNSAVMLGDAEDIAISESEQCDNSEEMQMKEKNTEYIPIRKKGFR